PGTVVLDVDNPGHWLVRSDHFRSIPAFAGMSGEEEAAPNTQTSCPGLSRATTSRGRQQKKTWMAGTSGAKTALRAFRPTMTAERLCAPNSRHAQFLLQAGGRGRVLEHQLLLRIDVPVCLLRHQRGLVEAGEDQLELARVGVDVADREETGSACLERAGIGGDQLFFHLEAPVGDRAKLHGEAEERQHAVDLDAREPAVIALD